MKTNYLVILAVMLSTSLVAQEMTSPPAAAPAAKAEKKKAAANASKKKAAVEPAQKKAVAAKKPAAVERPAFLVAGPALIAGSNVNVRGQATLNSEVVTRLNKGETVTVLEQINLEKPKADEPAQWAKIAFPANAHVWVNAAYIDATNKTVVPRKLNLRAGPGENYSVVGLLDKGAPVKEIVTKGNWMEIEAPSGAYAFVAAEYLRQEATGIAAVPAPTVVQPPTMPTPVAEAPPVAAAPTNPPVALPGVAPTTPTPEPVPATPVVEGPPPKRIVQHEGVVRPTVSIQAPTKWALVDPDTGHTVDYLYTTTTNLNLIHWRGYRVVVTGEEGLDERWGHTPVITIQRIQVVE
jgi:uncharacterized protein YgiM (DUF1202 family)